MTLPIRTTIDDVRAMCKYLATKPTGATVKEAKNILGSKIVDGRKLNALKTWGLVDDVEGKLKLSEAGRIAVKDDFSGLPMALSAAIKSISTYRAAIEKAAHANEKIVTAPEVAAYWHSNFGNEVSDSDKVLNDQAVCFFHVADGAGLGTLVVGRKGSPTRLDLNSDAVNAFITGEMPTISGVHDKQADDAAIEADVAGLSFIADAPVDGPEQASNEEPAQPSESVSKNNRVFITHGKNKKILEQIKDIVSFGKFEPVVAVERETTSKPVPEKVLDDMRSCSAAIIHVGSEGALVDENGKPHTNINGNVLIEIGAAMALYGTNFILLVEDGVTLPSNLQGLYECRYSGEGLDQPATMKLLKAFNDFDF